MVIIAIMSYPLQSANEMAKRFLAQPALPAYIAMKGPYMDVELGEGVKAISVYECDESKYFDAQDALATRYAKYNGVPGCSYSIHRWAEAKDALKAVGMA